MISDLTPKAITVSTPMHNSKTTIEFLFEDDCGEFWWKQCEKDGCPHYIYHAGDGKHCYPHQGFWYWVMSKINRLLWWR